MYTKIKKALLFLSNIFQCFLGVFQTFCLKNQTSQFCFHQEIQDNYRQHFDPTQYLVHFCIAITIGDGVHQFFVGINFTATTEENFKWPVCLIVFQKKTLACLWFFIATSYDP